MASNPTSKRTVRVTDDGTTIIVEDTEAGRPRDSGMLPNLPGYPPGAQETTETSRDPNGITSTTTTLTLPGVGEIRKEGTYAGNNGSFAEEYYKDGNYVGGELYDQSNNRSTIRDAAGNDFVFDDAYTQGARGDGLNIIWEREPRPELADKKGEVFAPYYEFGRDPSDTEETSDDEFYDPGEVIEEARDLFDSAKFASPLVLDLDGDGIETTNVNAGAYFDHDGNGFAEATGWVSPHDGILVRDRNADGRITSGAELFGMQACSAGARLHPMASRRLPN